MDQVSRRGDWMQTFAGRKFWPLDPRADEVFIVDIAHALAQQCRYAGHLPGVMRQRRPTRSICRQRWPRERSSAPGRAACAALASMGSGRAHRRHRPLWLS